MKKFGIEHLVGDPEESIDTEWKLQIKQNGNQMLMWRWNIKNKSLDRKWY